MKKIFIYILLFIILVSCICILTKKEKKETIKVAEVTHSLFYTPFYVALENNYFKDNDLDIELILTPGADKVSAAVLSNDVQIGFAGPETTIYVYNGGEQDYLKTFAGLTKKDGQFIVGRNKEDDFKLNNLKNKEVVVGRLGGMPALNFTNALYNEGIKEDEVNINYSVEYAALSGAFISGVGDYVNLFEPNATRMEEQKLGYIVGNIGDLSGEMPYTAFFARKSYIDNNKEIINKFRNAINKGIKYVKEHDSKDIAKVVLNQFPDTSLNEIEKIINNYKNIDTWFDNTIIEEDKYKNLEDILIRANLINDYVNFNDLVIND